MPESKRRSLDIALILLGVMVVELALNRLAVPALRPATETPEQWHRSLDHLALFTFHFASALSVGVVALLLWRAVNDERYSKPIRGLLAVSGTVFSGVALYSVIRSPTIATQFTMQSVFSLTVVIVIISQLRLTGDPWVKLGVIVLATPILLQYYAPFVLHLFDHADLSLYPNIPNKDLPARMREWGQHVVVLAALVSPYLFAPRPIRLSVPRPAPLVIAAFVGLIAGIILREQREVGMELAMLGLGFDIGPPGAPRTIEALYLLALTSVTWTLVSCLIADSPSRRRIGVGIGLIVIGGYAYEWPLQYLVAMIGLLVIADASDDVAEEESSLAAAERAFHLPPISSETWRAFVDTALAALREWEDDGAKGAQTIASDKGQGIVETHIVAQKRGVAVQIMITRAHDAVHMIDVLCGRRPPENQEPDWTLHARSDRVLAIGSHPEPPPTTASAVKIHDAPFDRRFRVRDRDKFTDQLFDDGLRVRATVVVDGWLAYWKGSTLYYRVFPGRGAPLDTPIPISELAMRGADAPPSVEKLLGLLNLLTEIAERAGLDQLAPDESAFFDQE